jgi:16S rRNA (adenine1518-N6/adenine1519-N6)-dimethyltransferase
LLSVLVQRAFAPSIVRHVSPGAFFPRPKVQSVVVCGERLPALREPTADAQLVAAARAAFHTRRKMLANGLAIALVQPKEKVEAAVVAADIDPKTRAEDLSCREFARLGQTLAAAGLLSNVAA